MPIQYQNIQRGKEVLMTASEYDKIVLNHTAFEQDFLKPYPQFIQSFQKKCLSNNTVLYSVRYKGTSKDICILFGPLKNSGTDGNANKRIQVIPATPLHKDTIYFAIGAYNTRDKHLYCCLLNNVREFILHAKKGTTYSSLWLDYTSLCTIYREKEFSWVDNRGRKVIGATNDNLRPIHEAIISLISTKNNDQEEESSNLLKEGKDIALEDFSKEIKKYKETDDLPRNSEYRKMAINRENCTCELCGVQHTFIDASGNEYFEGHHLIMYNPTVQRRYKFCLDHPDNIICLCPNCHKKIHNSSVETIRELIVKLFTKHNKLLKEFGISDVKELENIIADYTR